MGDAKKPVKKEHWFWRNVAPFLFYGSILGWLVYIIEFKPKPEPFPCEGVTDIRVNCLDRREWQEYLNRHSD